MPHTVLAGLVAPELGARSSCIPLAGDKSSCMGASPAVSPWLDYIRQDHNDRLGLIKRQHVTEAPELTIVRAQTS